MYRHIFHNHMLNHKCTSPMKLLHLQFTASNIEHGAKDALYHISSKNINRQKPKNSIISSNVKVHDTTSTKHRVSPGTLSPSLQEGDSRKKEVRISGFDTNSGVFMKTVQKGIMHFFIQ